MALCGVVRLATQMSSRTTVVAYTYRRTTYSTGSELDRYYTKKHEWVSVSNSIGTVGISEYAQEALGEVVFAQLPDVGQQVKSGEECGALESVKAASEVYSPISGKVTEKNTQVESTPSLINKSCYKDGWLFRVALTNSEEVKKLMDQATYEKYLKESDH